MPDESILFLDACSWALNVGRLRLDLYRVVAAILASRDFELSQGDYAALPSERYRRDW